MKEIACPLQRRRKSRLRNAASVLGRAWEPYDRSVDVHVSNLRKKLASVSDGRLEIETIRGIGYRVRHRP